jgi:hypothetical protein
VSSFISVFQYHTDATGDFLTLFMEDTVKKVAVWGTIIFLFFFSDLGLSCLDTYAASVHEGTGDAVVSISGAGRSLKEIIQEVAAQSGYRIEISESLLDQQVTGKFVNTDIEIFFNRVLRGSDIFQIIDQGNKTIRLFVTARTQERILVVEAEHDDIVESYWLDSGLDGEPDKTNKELLQARDEVFQNYNFGEQILDGELEKTNQDLLDEREGIFENYNADTYELDGQPGQTTGDILRARKKTFENYDSAKHNLDGEPGRTTQDLLDNRKKQFENYDPNSQPLDGEPTKTFQDLLDERDRVYGRNDS